MKTVLLSLFILSSICMSASNNSTDFQTILISRVWARCEKDGNINDGKIKIRFTATHDTLVMILEENGRTQKMTAEYYLSSTPDIIFDKRKIGNKDGAYVIVNSSQDCIVLTINSFSDIRIEYTFMSKDQNSGKEFMYDSTVVAVDNH